MHFRDSRVRENMTAKRWGWTFLVSGGHFWVDFYGNMLPPLLPFVAVIWGLSNSQLALLVSLQSMTANFLQPVFGYFTDKYRLKWSLGLGLLIATVPICFLHMAGNYVAFMIMVVVAGFGSAIYHPLGATRVVEGDHQQRAVKMSIFSGLGSLGYSISPAITALIVSLWGLQGLLLLIIPGLSWFFLLCINRTKTNQQVQGGEEHDKVKSREDGKNSDSRGEERYPAKYRPLILLSIVVGLRSWLATSTVVFIPLWLVAHGVNERTAGLYLTYYLLSGTLGGFIYGYFYRKAGAQKLLIGSFLLSLGLLPFYFWAPSSFQLPVLIVLGFILLGTIPITVVIGQELLPYQAGLASGITMGLAFGLGGLGTSFTGLLVDRVGTVTGLLLTSLVLIPAIIITWHISRAYIGMKNKTVSINGQANG